MFGQGKKWLKNCAKVPRLPFLVLCLAATVLFCIGIGLHFKSVFVSDPIVYGDDGDGLFNLWVLEHVYHMFPDGVSSLADGRIFWPAHRYTYWWSDNLLVPSGVYALCKQFFSDMYAAYRATILILSFLVYFAYVWLFAEVWRGVRTSMGKPLSFWSALWVPILAYLAFFSQTRIHDYLHFQHLTALFFVTLLIGALRHTAYLKRRDWMLMLLSELLLLYSAPYYAVLGMCILLCRVLFLLGDCRIHLWHWGWRHGLLALPVLLLSLPSVYMYGHGEPVDYSLDTVRSLSLQLGHLFAPLHGWSRTWLDGLLPDGLPAVRRGGYPGMGLLLAVGLTAPAVLIAYRRSLFGLFRPRVFMLFWFLLALMLIGDSDLRPVLWMLALVLIPFGLCLLIGRWRQTQHSAMTHQQGMLLAGLVAVYGTAFGPMSHFDPPLTDVSVWSVFSWFIPGYLRMREVLRFSSLGHFLLIATLWCFLLSLWAVMRGKTWAKVAMVSIVILLMGLQLSETVGMHVHEIRMRPGDLQLQESEAAFFRHLDGPMLVAPTRPFHRNTYHQLLWVKYSKLHLLNGYSARSTPHFDRLMMLEREHGPASAEQIAYAAELGADYLCMLRERTPLAAQQYVEKTYRVVFTNDRFLVVAL
jgi:hypothetical protein